jgi:RadC-like JAB domain
LGRHLITLGTVDSTVVAPREVFWGAILASASALIVAHNHPSGDPAPSQADIRVTRTLREAAKILQIELVGRVIVGTQSPSRRAGDFSPSGKPATCETKALFGPWFLPKFRSEKPICAIDKRPRVSG